MSIRADLELPRTRLIDRKLWVLIALGTGSFMTALDGSVVNMILTILRDAFRSDIATIEGVVIVSTC